MTLQQFREEFFAIGNVPINRIPSNLKFVGSPRDNIISAFLPGKHIIDSLLLFWSMAQADVTILGYNTEDNRHEEPSAILECSQYGLLIINLSSYRSNIVLKNLHIHCTMDIALQTVHGTVHVDHVTVKTAQLSLANTLAAYVTNSWFISTDRGVGRIGTLKTPARVENVSFSIDPDTHPSSRSFLYSKEGYLHVVDSNFTGGLRSAVYLYESELKLSGRVNFINNTGYKGGAVYLMESYIRVTTNTDVLFQDNHANQVGGAIYSIGSQIDNYISNGLSESGCVLRLECEKCTVLFENNTANNGGSATYGFTLSSLVCNANARYVHKLRNILSIEPDDFSAVASFPLRVCICPDQSTPDCLAILPDQNIPHLHYTVYPGQNFTLHATVVGFNFGPTSGSVHAQLLKSEASLGSESQYLQGASHTQCTALQYSVLSDRKQETLVLTSVWRSVSTIPTNILSAVNSQNQNYFTLYSYNVTNPKEYYVNEKFASNQTDGIFHLAGNVHSALQDTPLFISIALLDCPAGFTLSDQPHRCVCNERILECNLTCSINDQTVHREGTTWINASVSGNSSNGVIVHQHCPFGYCKQDPVDVDLTNPDIQCAYDRSGTLCGACKPNFSLALGGSQCLPNCSNSYLSPLIPFALAGFALVFFIKILNLTVSQGTLNGLIFYTNIVAANRSIFFPAQHNKFLSFLSVFISWLNLDLGIETCFIKGLDGYWKTWLQFVFPFYVWAIAGAIILVSHYSTRATKILNFGKNSHSVLATLFLLSYAKLIRSIIAILCFTTIVLSDDSSLAVWAFDGNIHYFSRKHIPLFLFALAIVFLLWLPYTAVLLSAQWLRTQTHRKGLRWLKPFLDAYYGTFKDKRHYWVGVLLVVRGVLFVSFASFFAVESNVNLLLIIVTCISLAAFPSISGRLYNKIFLSVLENTFFLNLGVLAAGTLYIRLVGGSQEALVTTSVGIALLQFIGITSFHAYRFVLIPVGNKCKVVLKARAESQSRASEMQPLLDFDSSEDEERPNSIVTQSEVCLSDLRREVELQKLTEAKRKSEAAQQLLKSKTVAEILFAETPQLELGQAMEHTGEHQTRVLLNPATNSTKLITFNHATPLPNVHPLETTDAAANETACAPSLSEAAAVSLDQPPPPPPPPPPPQESNGVNRLPRYFAAKREKLCFTDFSAPRETLLEYLTIQDDPREDDVTKHRKKF